MRKLSGSLQVAAAREASGLCPSLSKTQTAKPKARFFSLEIRSDGAQPLSRLTWSHGVPKQSVYDSSALTPNSYGLYRLLRYLELTI